MAERVKRRVAAARLAVAFVAAGAIAGAAASGQQNGPKPVLYEQAASDYFLKIDSIKGENIVDGSLLFKDIKKGQVPSQRQFQKAQLRHKHFEKVIFHDYVTKNEAGELYIKAKSLDDYIKHSEADARYIKVTDDVVRGKGSVFTESVLVQNENVQLLNLPNQVTVSALAGGQSIRIANTSGGTLTHSACGGTSGVLQPGEHVDCTAGDKAETVQFTVDAAGPVVTLTSSSIENAAGGGRQVTTQILIGM